MSILAITDVTLESISEAARRATSAGLDPDVVSDFLASIDWTGFDRASDGVRATLGDLEAWATEYDEGDLSREDYRARLERLIAVRPR